MEKEDFEKVVKSIKPYTDHVYLHLMGEPFLNKNIKTFLDICSEYELKVNITTNGTLINEVKEILINAESLRQINFSLHSFEANDSNIDFNEYLDNIINFIKEANEKTGVICTLRLWNQDLKYKASNDMNVDILTYLQEQFHVQEDVKETLKVKNSFKLRDRVYISMGQKFMWPSLETEELGERAFCYGLRDQIGVLVDGTVVPCCLDSEGSIPLGNIFEQNLGEIINGERAQAIYNGFSGRKAVEDLCKRCGFINRVR